MNDNNKKQHLNIVQISNTKEKQIGINGNPQKTKEGLKHIQQGFLSQADFNLQNILSSFFNNVEEEGLSNSMIVSKIAQIQSNKKGISKRHYNSSSSSSGDINSPSISSYKHNTNLIFKNPNRDFKLPSSNSHSDFLKSNETTRSHKASHSKTKQHIVNSLQLGELKNVTQSLSTRKNSKTSIANKTNALPKIKISKQDQLNSSSKIVFHQSEEKDVFQMIPIMKTSKDKNTLGSLCSEIHDKINIKPDNIPKGLLDIPSDRSHKKYNDEKIAGEDSDDELKLFKSDTLNPFKTINLLEIEKKEFSFRRLQRTNNGVYDSLSEDEENEQYEIDHTGINPNSIFKIIYDGILVLFTLYSFVYVPLSIAFIHTKIITHSCVFFFNLIIDFYYFIDIVLPFFTEYYDMEEQLIQDPLNIIGHYLTGWFFINFISGFPFITIIDGYMILYPNVSLAKSTFQLYSNSNIVLIHLIKVCRLIKGLKIWLENSFVNYMVENYFQALTYSKWTRLYITLITFFIFVHILSSLFIFLGFAYYPSWIEVNGLEIHSLITIYVTSLYYICITVFGIGYGDIMLINIHERVFSVILLMVGAMLYTWAVSSISSYSDPKDQKINEYKEKMGILDDIKLANNKLSTNLNKKIQRYLSYNLEHEQFNLEEILEQLPLKLKNEVMYEMYKSILDNFIFFKSFHNNDFSIKVLLSFKPIVMIKNELVVSEGDYLEEMFFVKQGLLALELPIPSAISEDFDKTNSLNTIINNSIFSKSKTKFGAFNETKISLNKNYTKARFKNKEQKIFSYQTQYVKLIEIRKNEHFGDIMMFLNQRCPLRVRIKSPKAELYLLKKTDAIDISMSFPKIWRKIIRKSLFNYEQLNRLVKKTLRFFFLSNQKSLYKLEKKYNLVSSPNHNDINITDLAFRNANCKLLDPNQDSSNNLATIPSCIDEKSSSNISNAQLPILPIQTLEEDNENENEVKNTENSTSQLLLDKGIKGILKINSTQVLPPFQLIEKVKLLNKRNSILSPKNKNSNHSLMILNDRMNSKKDNTVISIKNTKINDDQSEIFEDYKSKGSFEIQEKSKGELSLIDLGSRMQMTKEFDINTELISGEKIIPSDCFDKDEKKSVSNLNINECLLSIQQNCERNFIHCNNRLFGSLLTLDKTNDFEFIINNPSIANFTRANRTKKSIKSNKSNKSDKSSESNKSNKSKTEKKVNLLKNRTSIKMDSPLNIPQIQIVSSLTPLSKPHFQCQAENDKIPMLNILDLDKNILAIPGSGLGGVKQEEGGNISSRSITSDNANSFRSIFDSSKKYKTPDLKPRNLSPRNNSTHRSINVLNEIGENIHKNSINLNNPSLFYSNAFSDMINKVNNDQQIKEMQINKKLTSVLKIIQDNLDLV